MSQENKMRIRKYVHHSRQSNELGRRGGFSDWLMEYLHLFFDIFLCYLIAQSIAKTGKKEKKKKNLFFTLESDNRSWWHGAFVLGQQNYK